jgi:hydrogenase/urease accessory protein HupE
MKRTATLFILVMLILAMPAFAHPGHDHSAANSGLIHLLWLIPVIVAAVIVVFKEITGSNAGTDKTNRR